MFGRPSKKFSNARGLGTSRKGFVAITVEGEPVNTIKEDPWADNNSECRLAVHKSTSHLAPNSIFSKNRYLDKRTPTILPGRLLQHLCKFVNGGGKIRITVEFAVVAEHCDAFRKFLQLLLPEKR